MTTSTTSPSSRISGFHNLDVPARIDAVARFAERRSEGLFVGFYPTRPFDGMLNIMSDGIQRLQTTIESRPDQPYAAISLTGELSPGTQTIQIEDNAGNVLIAYELP